MREAILALAIFVASAAQGEPTFRSPIDCEIGKNRPCYIQSLVDHDPRPGTTRDHRCGPQSRDGHNGTDFALTSLQDMKRGVSVVAVAPGTVIATRDGMRDKPVTPDTLDQISGKECGNAVVLSHGAGWETQYCHLKNGSVTVKKGARVATGAKLGEVGLSGKTSFPHLHLSVRQQGRIIDPFAINAEKTCSTNATPTLWKDPLPYRPTGLISAGFAPAIPRYEDIKSGAQRGIKVTLQSQALVLWAYAFDGQPGDMLRFTISEQNGSLWHDKKVTLDQASPLYFRGTGRQLAGTVQWGGGTYQGIVRLIRAGRVVDERTVTVTVAK